MTFSRPVVNDEDCHLLKLPVELRLLIYSYALLAPEGVICQVVRMHGRSCFFRYTPYQKNAHGPKSSRDANATSSRKSAAKVAKKVPVVSHTNDLNQLKYVCCELHAETKGIIVANNNLVFDYGVDKFVKFVRTCPPKTLKTIRKVTIMESLPPTSRVLGHRGDYSALIDFCEQYPQTVVQLRHDQLRPDSRQFFWHALRFNLHFRKDPGFIAKVYTNINAQIEALNLAVVSWGATQLDDIQEYPPNLRAYPPYGHIS
ncbi:hypothetical protein DE146DRAFT_751735 [Phaeosphaeria sp. MPI-PUGE-AT-0046c]|nr:hypothetical protein DE146DRAFT_751735 [Phaeosphaeria sp. MPI-PUGE-AT-0046c]